MTKRKKYRIKGTRVTEQGPGGATDVIVATDWFKAVKKARALGYTRGDLNVCLLSVVKKKGGKK